ncbi:MAG: phospholipid carrier-dependent glycosyltransferase [Clostridiaceae bacterium]|nr:phospholipid carrier-dependent glycosyltransferase [Clostridiaceae bacterium]
MKTNQRQVKWICAIQLIALCILCTLSTMLHISDTVPVLISGMVLLSGSLLIFIWLKSICNGFQCSILFCGYLLRIVFMLLDLYARKYFTLLHSGADTEGFFQIACQYYHGDYSDYRTWYPYVINGIFSIFGQNRFIAQYMNIIFWVFTAFLILKICDLFHVSEHSRLLACGLLAFLPNNIILSSILLRESMMIFFDLLGMYYMVLWLKNGRRRYLLLAFLAPIPAIILHTASIGMWVAFALITALWNKKRGKYAIGLKTGLVLVGGILFVFILFLTSLSSLFLAYIGNDFSIYAITHRIYDIGGSNYLMNMDYQHWYELIPFTLIRMFYFVCSPVLTECRGLRDYFCVLGDVLPTVFVLFNIGINMRKKNLSRYALVGIFSYVITVGIFAWGTANAGTAMRHRGLLWGVLVATYCIGFGRDGELQ